ncbi:unnamed protein product [Bathycoccus prasinos]|jgi:hypothetical protein|tara:strand:- start:996 stop:2615 length:1620 start_codon:yes stop_codon:yes gene_type:complete
MRSSSAFEDLDDDDDDAKIVRFKISRSKRPKTVFASSSSSFKDDFFVLQLSENENETVALGETARWLISAQNANNDDNNRRVATKTRIKAEVLVGNKNRFSQKRRGVSSASIQQGGATSFILLDEIGGGGTTEACSLKPSESREAEVQFSAKHLGEHTLKCTAEYVDCPYDERSAVTIMNVAGENTVYDVGVRKRAVSYFSFNVTNPLHVRTKTRRVFTRSRSEDSDNNSTSSSKEKVFLEATIENVDKAAARLITKVHLIVDERRHISTALFPEIADEETLFDVGNNKNQIYLQKGGGAAHFLFELIEADEWGVSSSSSTTTSTSGKDELGTLEICWLGSTGEPGRLQTQPILAPKPSDTTPPQIMRGTSLGGGGEYSRPIFRTTVEILNNEEDENVPNGANNIAATINRAVKVTAVTAERPFLVRVKVSNLSPTTDSGAVELRIEDDTASNNDAKTQNNISNNDINALLSHSGTIRVNGESMKILQEIPKNNGSREALFEMVALAPGVKKLPQLTVRELNGRILLSPAAREVFVLAP